MTERYLCLDQPRGRERSICLALLRQDGGNWAIVRRNLYGPGRGMAQERLLADASLPAAEERFDTLVKSYFSRGWYPPECPGLAPKELLNRFVDRWPCTPAILAYDAATIERELVAQRPAWGTTPLGLQHYRGGRRMLLRLSPTLGVVLSNAVGLKEPAPEWLPSALTGIDPASLPAVFEVRVDQDLMVFTDLIHAGSDLRAEPFDKRSARLQELWMTAQGTSDPQRLQLGAVTPVTALLTQIERAVAQGFTEIVVRDLSLAYYYGVAQDQRVCVAWEILE